MDTTALWIARTGIARGQTKQWNTLWKWREKQTITFENKELAEFMEDMVRGLVAIDPTQVTVVAVNENAGVAATQYYNCGISDKGYAMVHILEDIIDEFIQNNASRIRQLLLDAEDDDDEMEDDEIE